MLRFPSAVGGMRKWPYAIKDVIWTLVLNARGKDGGKSEEESCGADTGVQRFFFDKVVPVGRGEVCRSA